MLLKVISIYLIASIVATTFFSAFIQSRGKGNYVKAIFLLSLAMDFYMFGYLQELASSTMDGKLFWNCFQYFGIPFISALWLTAGLMYTNHLNRFMKLKLVLIYSVPVMTFLLRFTNDMHHLYFKSFHLESYQGYSLLIRTGGIGYEVQGIHSGTMILIAMIIYIATFLKNGDFSGEKILYMAGASFVACLGLAVTSGASGIDYMALCLPVAMFLVLMAIFRNDFLEIKMLARELVFEGSKEGILLLDSKMKILDYNKSAEDLLKDHHVMLAKRPLDLVVKPENPLNTLLRSSVTATWNTDDQYSSRYYEVTTTNIFHKNGSVYGKIKIFRDITEIQLRTNYLKTQATVDELSGLLNRRAFMNACQSVLNSNISEKERCFLLMFDLDFFKEINDTFGHVTGDYVIEWFGSRLKEDFRGPDLSGRLGGEEFAVFMKEIDMEAAFARAEQFRIALEESEIRFNDKIIHITVSVGIAEACTTDNNIGILFNQADKAMYASKDAGRNKTSVYDSVRDPVNSPDFLRQEPL
jgi:diguanylate cyclase (GGDEF) domain